MVKDYLTPVALKYGYSEAPLEANIKWKPLVLVLGNYSSGKSTLINGRSEGHENTSRSRHDPLFRCRRSGVFLHRYGRRLRRSIEEIEQFKWCADDVICTRIDKLLGLPEPPGDSDRLHLRVVPSCHVDRGIADLPGAGGQVMLLEPRVEGTLHLGADRRPARPAGGYPARQ